jgi:hypothetical protein
MTLIPHEMVEQLMYQQRHKEDTRVVVFMVDNEGFVGNEKKNPFEFTHNNLNYISVEAGGQSYPAQFGGDNNNYIQSYMTMFTETGRIFDDRGNDITRESFRK